MSSKQKVILISIGLCVLAGILVNASLDDPEQNTFEERIEFYLQTQQVKKVKELYFSELPFNKLDPDFNYEYIHAHFDIPERKKVGKNSYEYRSDDEIIEYYTTLSNYDEPEYSDQGYYGLGLIHSIKDEFATALSYFELVDNTKRKYLNNSIGYCLKHLDRDSLAEVKFKQALANEGNIDGAISNLSRLYLEEYRLEELDALIEGEYGTHVSYSVNRKAALLNGRFIEYSVMMFTRPLLSINGIGFIGAALILILWVLYLKKIDLFEAEPWKYVIPTILMGVFFSFFTSVLSDYNQNVLDFHLNGEIVNDFLYSVIGIGMVEEFVKIIPLLILIKYTDIINESYDYIHYACLSALGFAFAENLLYFHDYQLHIISSRALMTSVAHMFLSSIVAYGFVLNKYRYKSRTKWRLFVMFFLASLGHGFYDFWLINERVSGLGIFSLLFFLFGISVWNSLKNNALNQSEFYDRKKKLHHDEISAHLVYSLIGIILFEYIALSIKFGPTAGNQSFWDSVRGGAYLLYIVSFSLGQFKVKKGKWNPIKFWAMSEQQGSLKGDPNEVVGNEIDLNPFSNNDLALLYVPNKGRVEWIVDMKDEYLWYLVKLENPGQHTEFHDHHVLIRLKESDEVIDNKKKVLAGLYLIKKEVSLRKEEYYRPELEFVHWVKVFPARVYQELEFE